MKSCEDEDDADDVAQSYGEAHQHQQLQTPNPTHQTANETKQQHTHKRNVKVKVTSRDEILFSQPEGSFLGDCPICFLQLSHDLNKSVMHSCCVKTICIGCLHANKIHKGDKHLKGRRPQKATYRCPFCRQCPPKTDEEYDRNLMNRITASNENDPVALLHMGTRHYKQSNYKSALEYWSMAASLGNAAAHFHLSILHQEGKEGVVEKDNVKALFHLEESAIAGHPDARCNLGQYEWMNQRFDRAVLHWMIAARLGSDNSIQALKKCYTNGSISKEDFASALRAYQDAVARTKSPQREKAEALLRRRAK